MNQTATISTKVRVQLSAMMLFQFMVLAELAPSADNQGAGVFWLNHGLSPDTVEQQAVDWRPFKPCIGSLKIAECWREKQERFPI